MRDPEQSSWAWPWCGCSPGQWVWSAVSTLIASAARPALARVFHWAVGVVDRVHVDRVHSALGLSEGAPPGAAGVVGRVRSAPGPGAGAPLWCGRALSARVRVRGRVVDTDARCRHREGVVDIVRGLLTPRGGYNARWCQQRASTPGGAPAPERGALRTRSTWTRSTAPTTRGHARTRARRAVDTADHARCPVKHPHQGQTPGGLLRIAHHPLGVRTQGPRFKKHAPHTTAGSSPCVRFRVA